MTKKRAGQKEEHFKKRRARAATTSDLLRPPLVAERPQLVRVLGAHLVQSGQVPGQVRPKVLGGFGQVGDVLAKQCRAVVSFRLRLDGDLTGVLAT